MTLVDYKNPNLYSGVRMIKKHIRCFHFISLLCLMFGTFLIPQIPLLVCLVILGISLCIFMGTFFIILKQEKNKFLTGRIYWYITLIINMFFMKLFTSNLLGLDVLNAVNYIVALLLIFGFAFSFLWTSKKKFSNVIHILNIILISTYILIELSELFYYYYLFVYEMDAPFDYYNRTLSYVKFSLRYFFEFPSEEYLDLVTFLQFIIGRIYEAILLGGVISCLTSTFINSKSDKKDIV